MTQWPHLGLYGEFSLCEDGILEAINSNFELLDSLVQLSVINIVSELPGSDLTEGDIYILETDGSINVWDGGDWFKIQAQSGFLSYLKDEDAFYYFDGSVWIPFFSFDPNDYTPNVIEEEGDLIRGDGSGNAERLPIGVEGQVLKSVSGQATWSDENSTLLTDLNIFPNHSFETNDEPWTISSGDGSANFGTSGVLESSTNKRYLQVEFNDNELPVKSVFWNMTDILLNSGWVGVPIKCSFWYRTTSSNIIANASSFNEFIEQTLPNTNGQWRYFEMEFYNLTSTSYFSFVLKTDGEGGVGPVGIDIDEIYFGPSKEERGYPGKIEQTFSATPPSIGRWLPADGRTISRSGEYQRLFEYAITLIGPASDDLWGEGDGSTTFSIPDLNALSPRGIGTRTINGRNKVGPSQGKLQEDQMQRITGQLTKGSGIGILDTRGATVASGALSIGDETGRRRDGDDASNNARDLIFDSADSLGARASGDTDGETRVNAFGVYYWIRY